MYVTTSFSENYLEKTSGVYNQTLWRILFDRRIMNCVACGAVCVLFPSNYWLRQEKSSKCRWFVLFVGKKSLFCVSLPREEEEFVAICSRKKGISHSYFSPDECRVLTQTKRTQVSVRNNSRCVFFSTSELFLTFQYLQQILSNHISLDDLHV